MKIFGLSRTVNSHCLGVVNSLRQDIETTICLIVIGKSNLTTYFNLHELEEVDHSFLS